MIVEVSGTVILESGPNFIYVLLPLKGVLKNDFYQNNYFIVQLPLLLSSNGILQVQNFLSPVLTMF